MPITITIDGIPIAKILSEVATASIADRSVACISHHWNQVFPPLLPYSSTVSAEVGAPTHTGQERRITRHGVSLMHAKIANSSTSATEADTQSSVKISGIEAANAPKIRNTGFIDAISGERLESFGFSLRLLTALTLIREMSVAPVVAERASEDSALTALTALSADSALTSVSSASAASVFASGTSSTKRAPNASTSSRSCVTTIMLTPSLRRLAIKRIICSQVLRS
ncbi:hypothetical protein AXE76_00125 [Gardnerella vaginalis]|uniref:Uncharacterized protein n=1 Tax=Gardnerella vaginalis TaxID=2702 RepID=A0A3E1INU9_GARVA|nr:hypothetical protein AXE76_00125 [Gardnerella vaginalis]